MSVTRRRVYIALAISTIIVSGVWASTTAVLASSSTGPVTLASPGVKPIQYSATVSDGKQARTSSAGAALKFALGANEEPDVQSASVQDAPSYASGTGRWFVSTVKVADTGRGGSIFPFWQANLAQGVIADSLATTDDNTSGIAGSQISGKLTDGSIISLGGGAGDVRANQVFHDSTSSHDAMLELKIAAATIRHFGLKVVSLRLLHPKNDALCVVVMIPKSRVFSKLESLRVALTGTPARFEGVYLEIQDSVGKRVAISAVAFRTGAGSVWLDPSVAQTIGGPTHG